MITVTIEAFGYEHSFTDSWLSEEIEMIEQAPIIYLLSGEEDMIAAIENDSQLLPMDSVILWTDVGEALVFGYEEISYKNCCFINRVLDVAIEGEDRSEEETA